MPQIRLKIKISYLRLGLKSEIAVFLTIKLCTSSENLIIEILKG